MNDIKESKTFQKLIEYKKEFYYSYILYDVAYRRAKIEKVKHNRNFKLQEFSSIVFMVLFTISLSIMFITENPYLLIPATLFFLLSVYTHFMSINIATFTEEIHHSKTSNRYLSLQKEVESVIIRVKDGLLTLEKLSYELEKVEREERSIIGLSTKVEESDIVEAKRQITSLDKNEDVFK